MAEDITQIVQPMEEWSELAKELKPGDLVHVFGYIKERRNNDKSYKNFIVKHMNKIEKENKEEK